MKQMLPRADWRMPHLVSQRDSFRLATGGLKRAVIVAERRFDDADSATGKSLAARYSASMARPLVRM